MAGIHVELGPLAELLDGPPSDLLPSRLAILRGESDEARQAMIEVLLHEAPSRAALAPSVRSVAALWLRTWAM